MPEFDRFVDDLLGRSPADAALEAILSGGTSKYADHVYQFQSDSQRSRSIPNRSAYFDLLHETPGADLVHTIAHEGAEVLPMAGWIIHASIAPGLNGRIQTYKFLAAGMEPQYVDRRELAENLDEYGSASVQVQFYTDGWANHTIGYEDPGYPFSDRQPGGRDGPNLLHGMFDDFEVIDLEGGGRLLSRKSAEIVSDYSVITFRTEDLTCEVERRVSPSVSLNRIASSPEELRAITGHLAIGMGLSPEDGAHLTTASLSMIL